MNIINPSHLNAEDSSVSVEIGLDKHLIEKDKSLDDVKIEEQVKLANKKAAMVDPSISKKRRSRLIRIEKEEVSWRL